MKSSAQILLAGVDDLPELLALERETSAAPHWSQTVYRGYMAGTPADPVQRALFVARTGEHLEGFAAASLVAGEAELESMAVSASARRCGLGTQLLDAVKVWTMSHEGRVLRLEVRSKNALAQAFYLSQGFVCEGLRRGYYTAPAEDAVLMRLDVPPDMPVEKALGGEL